MKMRLNWFFLPIFVLALAFTSGCWGDKEIDPGGDGYGETVIDPLEIEALPGDNPQVGVAFLSDSNLERVEVDFSPVLFGYDSFQLAPREMAKIDQVAAYMDQNRGLKLVVQGHCDERGSREYNLSLGDRRALAVRSYLVSLGISPDRVQTQSYGEEQPVDPGHNEAAWRLNRRGEFLFFR